MLHKENLALKDANYDLRYELQEANIQLKSARDEIMKYGNAEEGNRAA